MNQFLAYLEKMSQTFFQSHKVSNIQISLEHVKRYEVQER